MIWNILKLFQDFPIVDIHLKVKQYVNLFNIEQAIIINVFCELGNHLLLGANHRSKNLWLIFEDMKKKILSSI